MHSEQETKVCPICAETIRSTAKKCPHCHHWQTKWHTTVFHPVFTALITIIPFAVCGLLFLVLGKSVDRALGPGEDFMRHRDQIAVLDSTVSFSKTEKGPFICTVGRIKNNSEIPWKDVQIEVQYFNSDGKLIDTASDRQLFVDVLPHDERAFRIRSSADKPESSYASHRVTIRAAKDGRSAF